MLTLDDFDARTIHGLEAGLTQQSLEDFLAAVRDRFGLANSVYVTPSPADPEPFVLTSYKDDWISHYRASRYEEIDPVYRIAARSVAPIDWAALPRGGRKVKRLFTEARDAGVGRQGLSIPIPGATPGSWGLFTATSDDNDTDWELRRHLLTQTLVNVGHYVHQQVRALRGEVSPVDPDAITRREIQALQWIAGGLTVAETAVRMRIAEVTVKSHLDSARYKLGALTRSHAVAKALRGGLIR